MNQSDNRHVAIGATILSPVKIRFPGTVLTLSGLNDNPPRSEQELAEAIDQILYIWADVLGDNPDLREEVGRRILDIVFPYLNNKDTK